MESQPVFIPNAQNKGTPYTPDAWLKFSDGKQVIFDIKHHTFFNMLENDPKEKQK
ncbi:MAG: hypothetical protein ACTSR8_15635 [Promethearchaeota archaeon]